MRYVCAKSMADDKLGENNIPISILTRAVKT